MPTMTSELYLIPNWKIRGVARLGRDLVEIASVEIGGIGVAAAAGASGITAIMTAWRSGIADSSRVRSSSAFTRWCVRAAHVLLPYTRRFFRCRTNRLSHRVRLRALPSRHRQLRPQ